MARLEGLLGSAAGADSQVSAPIDRQRVIKLQERFLDFRIFSKRAAGEAHAARNRFQAATRDAEVGVFNVIISELGALLDVAQSGEQPEAAQPSNPGDTL
jgi:hypothetical protein